MAGETDDDRRRLTAAQLLAISGGNGQPGQLSGGDDNPIFGIIEAVSPLPPLLLSSPPASSALLTLTLCLSPPLLSPLSSLLQAVAEE